MLEEWEITIPELSGDEVRRAYVYLPSSYESEPESRYPVLYMFDGHNLFYDDEATYGKCWGLREFMDYTDTPLIIAAVECTHDPDNGRLSEYSPYDFDERGFGFVHGRGHETMEWFCSFFKPYVDEHYRTLPERESTFIAGSSMGGLMSFYALIAYNDVFSRAAALSPSFGLVRRDIVKLTEGVSLNPDTHLYMDFGSEEIRGRKRLIRLSYKLCSMLTERGVFVESRVIPGGDHSEGSWERQVPFIMDFLLYGRD